MKPVLSILQLSIQKIVKCIGCGKRDEVRVYTDNNFKMYKVHLTVQ